MMLVIVTALAQCKSSHRPALNQNISIVVQHDLSLSSMLHTEVDTEGCNRAIYYRSQAPYVNTYALQ